MTIGHLIECLLSKVGALSGKEGDATPFMPVTVENVSDELHSLGYQKMGNEVMYSGYTGRKLEAERETPWGYGDRRLLLAPMVRVNTLPFRLLTAECGADVVTYAASDGEGLRARNATVAVSLEAANDAPFVTLEASDATASVGDAVVVEATF